MLNLNEMYKYRENNRIEAKQSLTGLPHSIWETYSAFANTNGGYILLGVEELPDRTLRAITLPDPEKLVADFWSIINNRQKVSVNILQNKHVQIAESENNRIVVIEVPRAERKDKPVYIGADPFTGSFRRNGEGDYHCTKDEVRNMMRDQSDLSQDLRVTEQFGLDAFDYESVRRYRNRLQILRPNHVWENLEPTEFLQKVGCVGRDENGVLRPTAAGILMFGFEYEIVKEFPHYFLDYQEHDNEDTRWTDRVVSNLGDWSGNIFDFYFKILNRMMQEVKTPFKLEGTTRVDDTPVHKALREALANALLHADYNERRGLVIQRSPQKITIANPGALRVNVGDAIVGGISDPRNITLVKLFNLLGVGERAGSGIPNIFSVWKNQGWPEPVLEEQFSPDRTILTLCLSPQDVGHDKNGTNHGKNGTKAEYVEMILEIIKTNPEITLDGIAELTTLSRRTVARTMKSMQVDGLIKRIGSTRGSWEILD